MPVIGQFPLMNDFRRRTVRAPTNPMDKSTIVSIFPKRIEERKYTIEPGLFVIEAGSIENPATLVVGPSSWWKEVDPDQPLLEIPHSSVLIAESVVRDYCNGIVGCDMGDNMPGMFFLPGDLSIEKIKKDHPFILADAARKQKNWYNTLVKLADALWSRSSGNPMSISDDMRMAARELNLIEKEWYKDNVAVELVRCKACGHLGNPNFPVCSNCKAVNNIEKAKALGLTFAS